MQRVDVSWAEGGEVAMVEGRELRLIQALDDRQDRSIDVADVGIRVPVAELPDAPIIDDRHRLRTFTWFDAGPSPTALTAVTT